MPLDKLDQRERVRRSSAGRYAGVIIEEAPLPPPAPIKRSWIPASLHADLAPKSRARIKWVSIIMGAITAAGALTAALLKISEQLSASSPSTRAQVMLLEKQVAELKIEIKTLKQVDNEFIASEESFRLVYGADRKENLAGEINIDGINQDIVRMRSERICEGNKPGCRPGWAFSAAVRPLPQPHAGVPRGDD